MRRDSPQFTISPQRNVARFGHHQVPDEQLDVAKALCQFYGNVASGSADVDNERVAQRSPVIELGDPCIGEPEKMIVGFDPIRKAHCTCVIGTEYLEN